MNKQQIEKAAKLLKVVANEKRLSVLYYIKESELKVSDIEKKVNLSQSALSQHLAILREKHIVKTRRESQTIYYSLKDEKTKELLDILDDLFRKI